MNQNKFYTLIMAGGKGTRFWPESTHDHPKQYLKLTSSKTLLEETCDRFHNFIKSEQRFVVTVEEQKRLCEESTNGKIRTGGIILEPSGRNTAPCILLSLASMLKNGATVDDVLAIVPSDHIILNQKGFQTTLKKAYEYCLKKNEIVTIGITPHFPHTGFGYIQKGEMVNGEAFKVSRFKEKPHFELAREYVRTGDYLWNAGMFVAPIKILLEEFQTHAPLMYKYFDQLSDVLHDPSKLKTIYDQIPADSLDYAIMEKSKRVSVIPAQFDWNDLGSWDALASVVDETNGNTIVKSDGQYFINSTDNIVYAPEKFVALINMEKHIVVVNDKVVLVAPIKDSQEVKKIVEGLKGVRDDLL